MHVCSLKYCCLGGSPRLLIVTSLHPIVNSINDYFPLSIQCTNKMSTLYLAHVQVKAQMNLIMHTRPLVFLHGIAYFFSGLSERCNTFCETITLQYITGIGGIKTREDHSSDVIGLVNTTVAHLQWQDSCSMGGKQYAGTMEEETHLALMICKGFVTQEYLQVLYNAVRIKHNVQLTMRDGHRLRMYKALLVR